jgi:tetratricopeptide (TPR) repeat protein
MNDLAKGLLVTSAMFVSSLGFAQAQSDYRTLIDKGNTQLQAGDAESARKAGEAATHQDATRWEGYALEGGALMNLKRYEEATDMLSKAIERAPESKQPALRDLRRQCLRADTGAPSVPSMPLTAAATSQAEVVLWKTIESSSNSADFQSYLEQYPNGVFAVLARRHLVDANTQAEREHERNIAKLVWADSTIDLMWPKHPPENPQADWEAYWVDKNFDQATRFCAQLRLLGHSDWRLPDVHELQAIHISQQGLEAVSSEEKYGHAYWTLTPGDKVGQHIVFHKGQMSVKDSKSAFTAWAGAWATMALCVRNIGEKP